MQDSIAQCRYLLRLAEGAVDDLDDSHAALSPMPGRKTAGWLIGHLVVTADGGRRICGREALCPKEWRRMFGRGSQPSAIRGEYPAMSQLRAMLTTTYDDLCDVALSMSPEFAAAVNPYEPARGEFPSIGLFVRWMLTGHLAYHLGQLTLWREATGMDARRAGGRIA